MTFEQALIAGIVALWGVVTTVAAAYHREVLKSRDRCCEERDTYKQANEDALAAYRRREDEERQWRQQQERVGRAGGAP